MLELGLDGGAGGAASVADGADSGGDKIVGSMLE